jgi:hypothetical protein
VFEESPTDPSVIEFGPTGGGCAKGSMTVPTASTTSSGGQPILEKEPIPIKDTVTLSSELAESNALEVEWELGNEPKITVSTDEHEKTELKHTFTESGELEVKERVHTDDLAFPVLETHRKIDIQGSKAGGQKPAVAVVAATDVTATTATLNGTVNPEGAEVTSCTFEYGTSLPSGKTEPCAPSPGSGKGAVAVSAAITGLTADTTYRVKLSATNAAGTGEATSTFGPKPSVVADAASGVTQNAATLNATVNPEGAEVTSCTFEYGTTTSYGSSAPCSSAPGSGTGAVPVSTSITGLAAKTTYHFRVVATNATGSAMSSDQQFATAEELVQVLHFTEERKPEETKREETHVTVTPPVSPDVTLSGDSAAASSSGAFTLKLQCPTGASGCTGTITLKTSKAVVASVGHAAKAKKKAAILTLAEGSFTIAGGQLRSLTLRLSAAGRTLLAHSHVLSAQVTIAAHDATGETATTKATVTLRPAKVAKKH